MVELPISSSAAHFSQEYQIFNRYYTLEFCWIENEGYWVLHVYDEREQPIALGMRLIAEWPIAVEDGLTLLMLKKKPNALLTIDSLSRDFLLVAYDAL
jgi:Domain of unknown function (DUF6983)